MATLKYKKGTSKRERLFPKVSSYRTRVNGVKLKETKFGLDIGKKFFVMSMVRHWNRLP